METTKKQYREKITVMQYRTIEKGFYEISVLSDFKIIAEGNVCSGVLLELMEKTKQDRGKIVKVKGRMALRTDDVKIEMQQLIKENQTLRNKITAIKKMVAYV